MILGEVDSTGRRRMSSWRCWIIVEGMYRGYSFEIYSIFLLDQKSRGTQGSLRVLTLPRLLARRLGRTADPAEQYPIHQENWDLTTTSLEIL